jgi:hypothetical protein
LRGRLCFHGSLVRGPADCPNSKSGGGEGFRKQSEPVIRPEVRYDTSLNNTTPFAQNTSGHQWTIGFDAILEF